MYLLRLMLIPTGALLFRRVPFATTVFPTYPFMPPTVLAGFLRRVVMLAKGYDLPGDIPAIPSASGSDNLNARAQFFTLPPDYVCLGAYPQAHTTHRTKRHQPWGAAGSFNHMRYSALRYEKGSGEGEGELTPQIPVWEYLHADRLVGYVLHTDRAKLEELRQYDLKNWGCKVGKEGFVFIEEVSEVVELRGPERRQAVPATPVPAEAVGDQPADFFTLYAYEWQSGESPAVDSLEGVDGKRILLKPFLAAWIRQPAVLDYYTDGGAYFPVVWVKKLMGQEADGAQRS